MFYKNMHKENISNLHFEAVCNGKLSCKNVSETGRQGTLVPNDKNCSGPFKY